MKSIDPAHLVMVSSWGYFGRSTPELQPQNPFDLTWRGIGNNAGVRKADSFGCVWHLLPCILSEVLRHILSHGRVLLLLAISFRLAVLGGCAI